MQDMRFSIRSLNRTKGLTAFVALGIGITSGTFSMVDAPIFRPYPLPNPGNACWEEPFA